MLKISKVNKSSYSARQKKMKNRKKDDDDDDDEARNKFYSVKDEYE